MHNAVILKSKKVFLQKMQETLKNDLENLLVKVADDAKKACPSLTEANSVIKFENLRKQKSQNTLLNLSKRK